MTKPVDIEQLRNALTRIGTDASLYVFYEHLRAKLQDHVETWLFNDDCPPQVQGQARAIWHLMEEIDEAVKASRGGAGGGGVNPV